MVRIGKENAFAYRAHERSMSPCERMDIFRSDSNARDEKGKSRCGSDGLALSRDLKCVSNFFSLTNILQIHRCAIDSLEMRDGYMYKYIFKNFLKAVNLIFNNFAYEIVRSSS